MFFFFNDPATTEIYTLSLHDALPICRKRAEAAAQAVDRGAGKARRAKRSERARPMPSTAMPRSEEHTSELQSPCNLVCRLLLEKKENVRVVRRLGVRQKILRLCRRDL